MGTSWEHRGYIGYIMTLQGLYGNGIIRVPKRFPPKVLDTRKHNIPSIAALLVRFCNAVTLLVRATELALENMFVA